MKRVNTWFFLIGPRPVRLAISVAFVCVGISTFLALKVRDQVLENRRFICNTAALQAQTYSSAVKRESTLATHTVNPVDRVAHARSAAAFRRIDRLIVRITPSYCDPTTGRLR